MSSSATNSSRNDAARVVADDVIEFAEFTDDEVASDEAEVRAPVVAPPQWFKARPSSARLDVEHADSVALPQSDDAVEPATDFAGIDSAESARRVNALPRTQQPTDQRSKSTPQEQRSERAVANKAAKAVESAQRRRRSKSSTEAPATKTDKKSEDDVGFDWAQWRQALRRAVIGAYGTSLLIHVLILVVLSAVFIQQKVTSQAISTQLSDADGVPQAFDGLVELSLPKAGADLTKSPLLMPTPIADPRLIAAPDVIANAVQTNGKENGSSEFGDSDGFQFKMPMGGKAVTKGSFAAWTVPADPKPREDYLIIIRIKLPAALKTYRVADISGEVTGTDAFRLVIPFDQRRPDATRTERSGKVVPVKQTDLLRIVDGHAQIVVSIPGAAALVKDSIRVKSKLLKEEQSLEIEF